MLPTLLQPLSTGAIVTLVKQAAYLVEQNQRCAEPIAALDVEVECLTGETSRFHGVFDRVGQIAERQ